MKYIVKVKPNFIYRVSLINEILYCFIHGFHKKYDNYLHIKISFVFLFFFSVPCSAKIVIIVIPKMGFHFYRFEVGLKIKNF